MQVTAESPLIDVKQNAAASDDHRGVIERIPKGRDFTDLVRTAPGTQQERKSGIQIDGAGGSEHRYVIDGMDTTGIRTGVSGQEMPTDFIQEVQVKSSGYNAEFRATTGGVISAITKTGSNQWRGSAGYLLPQQQLQRRAAADAAAQPVRPDARPSTSRRPTTSSQRHRAEFELGGPILRDRVWFYRRLRRRTSSARSRTVTFRTNSRRRRSTRTKRTTTPSATSPAS